MSNPNLSAELLGSCPEIPFQQTMNLRFILRDGKRILQQQWERIIPFERLPQGKHTCVATFVDVPLCEEY